MFREKIENDFEKKDTVLKLNGNGQIFMGVKGSSQTKKNSAEKAKTRGSSVHGNKKKIK